MNKAERILLNLFWFLIVVVMIIGSFYNNVVMTLTFVAAGLLGLFYGLSFTPFGPFTQMGPGRYLAVKRGLNIIKYYLNQEGWGVANDGMTFLPDPNGYYLKKLRKNFFFRYLGMVWTGFPPVGGVQGSWVKERKVRFSQNADGTLKYWVEDTPATYYIAPPFMRHFGFVLGAIPSKGNNTWNFVIPSRILVVNPKDYDHRLVTSPDSPIKGSFESALRPLIKNLQTHEILNLKSEDRRDRNSIAAKAKEKANQNMVSELSGGYGYGVILHDVDFQAIEPAEHEFAKAIRMKEIAEEVGEAELREADWKAKKKLRKNEADVEIIRTKGEATAKAQELFVKATGNNSAAWLAKGMGDVKEHVTLVIGDGVTKNILLGGQKGHKEEPNTGKA